MIDKLIPWKCNCTHPDECYNFEGKINDVICRLKDDRAATLKRWAYRLFYDYEEKDT